MLGIIIVLLAILVIELSRRRTMTVNKMVVGEEVVEHETVEKAKHREMPEEKAEVADVKPKFFWQKGSEKPKNEKYKEPKQKEGFAKTCIEVWAIPTYVVLGLLLIFFLQLLFYGMKYLYTVIGIGIAIIAAAAAVFFIDRHLKKKYKI
ncbi:hypothetical protein KY311_02230 [Candidatus Woesearchaeota archaeon]|nr:hypothetical protein [Candidatus Woesearchaeota archaeon]